MNPLFLTVALAGAPVDLSDCLVPASTFAEGLTVLGHDPAYRELLVPNSAACADFERPDVEFDTHRVVVYRRYVTCGGDATVSEEGIAWSEFGGCDMAMSVSAVAVVARDQVSRMVLTEVPPIRNDRARQRVAERLMAAAAAGDTRALAVHLDPAGVGYVRLGTREDARDISYRIDPTAIDTARLAATDAARHEGCVRTGGSGRRPGRLEPLKEASHVAALPALLIRFDGRAQSHDGPGLHLPPVSYQWSEVQRQDGDSVQLPRVSHRRRTARGAVATSLQAQSPGPRGDVP